MPMWEAGTELTRNVCSHMNMQTNAGSHLNRNPNSNRNLFPFVLGVNVRMPTGYYCYN